MLTAGKPPDISTETRAHRALAEVGPRASQRLRGAVGHLRLRKRNLPVQQWPCALAESHPGWISIGSIVIRRYVSSM